MHLSCHYETSDGVMNIPNEKYFFAQTFWRCVRLKDIGYFPSGHRLQLCTFTYLMGFISSVDRTVQECCAYNAQYMSAAVIVLSIPLLLHNRLMNKKKAIRRLTVSLRYKMLDLPKRISSINTFIILRYCKNKQNCSYYTWCRAKASFYIYNGKGAFVFGYWCFRIPYSRY